MAVNGERKARRVLRGSAIVVSATDSVFERPDVLKNCRDPRQTEIARLWLFARSSIFLWRVPRAQCHRKNAVRRTPVRLTRRTPRRQQSTPPGQLSARRLRRRQHPCLPPVRRRSRSAEQVARDAFITDGRRFPSPLRTGRPFESFNREMMPCTIVAHFSRSLFLSFSLSLSLSFSLLVLSGRLRFLESCDLQEVPRVDRTCVFRS